jgi:hypothetical protein
MSFQLALKANSKIKEKNMVVFLKLLTYDSKEIGVLGLYHLVWADGSVSQNYEFMGNGRSDGGTWQWANTEKEVVINFTSNLTMKKNAQLCYGDRLWKRGIIPPPLPWFQDNDNNLVRYIDQNGIVRYFHWLLKI